MKLQLNENVKNFQLAVLFPAILCAINDAGVSDEIAHAYRDDSFTLAKLSVAR